MSEGRDDFTASVKQIQAKRVGYFCSNPVCRQLTIGPHQDPMKTVSIGVAAHIAAASPGGARFDSRQSPAERSNIDNAIWLCQSCSRLIDMDAERYTCEVLRKWRSVAEENVLRELESGRKGQPLGFAVSSSAELCTQILKLLEENHMFFTGYGPNAGAADEGPVRWDLQLWYKARDERIRPNNLHVLAILDDRPDLVPDAVRPHVAAFKLHAHAFEAHCQNPSVKYSDHRYPPAFAEAIKNYVSE